MQERLLARTAISPFIGFLVIVRAGLEHIVAPSFPSPGPHVEDAEKSPE